MARDAGCEYPEQREFRRIQRIGVERSREGLCGDRFAALACRCRRGGSLTGIAGKFILSGGME
jgi:hypothetical protein